jgi:hypothetical protein
MNVFKVVPLPKKVIESMDDFEDEADFFGLLQVGVYRDNEIQIEDFKKLLEILLTKVFDSEKIKILLEINFKGELLLDKIVANDNIPQEVFLYTKHTESARISKPGIKYNEKNKEKYCEMLRILTRGNRIILNEKTWTIPELFSFGLTGKGTYASQSGHDDVAMTVVNLSALFDGNAFFDLISEIYDELDEGYKELIESKLDDTDPEGGTKEGGFYGSFSKLL